MSHDFEAAIEEGATIVRVGTAIFGARRAAVSSKTDTREAGAIRSATASTTTSREGYHMFDRTNPPASTSAASAGSSPAERVMRIAPLDLRQQRFRTQLRGFDRTEVVAFLTEAADDYEHALREIDRLRQDLVRQEALLVEHREREANLRNTLLTAQRLADEIKEAAQNEAKLIVREAQGRADLLLQKAQGRLEEVERDINELRLRRRDVEGSLEGSIQALYRALEFIREQDRIRRQGAAPPPATDRGAGGWRASRAASRHATGSRRARLQALPSARVTEHRKAPRVLVLRHCRQLITCAGPAPRRGADQGPARVIARRRPRGRWTAGLSSPGPQPISNATVTLPA